MEVGSFSLRVLYHRGKISRYPMDRKLRKLGDCAIMIM
jgi:hypothetical protein